MRVKITKCSGARYWYAESIGEICEVVSELNVHGKYSVVNSPRCIDVDDCVVISEKETEGGENMEKVTADEVVIDGEKYREVKRNANVGDTVKVVWSDDSEVPVGTIAKCTRCNEFSDWSIDVKSTDGRGFYDWDDVHYAVLDPFTEEFETVELIVLQRKVNELTRQLDGLTGTVAKLTEKITKDERKVTVKSPLTRDEIVAKAAADVAELQKHRYDDVNVCFTSTDRLEFVVNRENRTVVALVRGKGTGYVYRKSIAKAAPGDVFNEILGRAIALRRALGLPVPAEYTDAPKPEGVRVGDVVIAEGKALTVVSDSTSPIIGEQTQLGSWYARLGKVVDDSARYDASGKVAA